ncbi:hypothetical protein BJX61DRAFT_128694 [Aspergillus egyptiacus]|nr:hypothetical protein BJX61DRAFT_128694 [Aspergillus egyptiacus]
MRLNTVATTVTQPAQTPTTQSSALAQHNAISDPRITSWLSRWLWSFRSDEHSDPRAGVGRTNDPRHIASTDVEVQSSTSGQSETSPPCRACQAWGVKCDLQKPRCSHCLDQQILCFYVEPLRVTMKRSRQSKKLHAAHTDGITS